MSGSRCTLALAVVGVAALGWAFPALAATLTVGAATLSDAGVTALPVTLARSSQEAVGGIQFDLAYPVEAATVSGVVAGPALASTGKTLQYTALDPGRIRVIVAGLNLNTIPAGVVAEVQFIPVAGAAPGTYAVEFEDAILSTPYGQSVPATVVAGTITVPGTTSICDINRDRRLDAVDVQLVVNAALARDIGSFDADIQNDGRTDAMDVQVVINAVLGRS